MGYNWATCSSEVKLYVLNVQKEIEKIIADNIIGSYLHGSLAMGGFNPSSSDVDILVITRKSLRVGDKRKFAEFFLNHSNEPHPIEISFLNKDQLRNWQHPCRYDFHYSEFWRERYKKDLLWETHEFLNENINTDADLAAHITIINHRGVCIKGNPINTVFPTVPKPDYISSLLIDYKECLKNLEKDPIYCSLNMIRVYWYLKEEVISSKQEAGIWALRTFPQTLKNTIEKLMVSYEGSVNEDCLNNVELKSLKNFISDKVEVLLK